MASRFGRAPRFFMALDYDGVLAPLQRHANRAMLSGPLRRLLRQMSMDPKFQLAIVSGRALRDLREKVPFPKVILAGNHGMDIQFPGKRERHGNGIRYHRALQRAKRRLAGLLQQYPGTFLEDKLLGFGVHYRAVRNAQHKQLLREFDVWRKKLPSALCVIYQKFVFDVIPNVSWDKGKAVRQIWDRVGRNALPIYMGDDQTDESAFRALRRQGITVLVGSMRPSRAEYCMRSCNEVPRFLGLLRDLLC
jgi:trehalose 6-phosphate phosphatase